MTAEQAFADFQRNWQKTNDPPDEERYPFMCGFSAGAAAAVKEEAGKLVFATIDYEHRIEELEREAAAQRPIPVTERLPPDGDDHPNLSAYVLGWDGISWHRTRYVRNEMKWIADRSITHWLPLPAAPERT